VHPTESPRIAVTTMVAATQDEPAIAARKNELYADGVRRHGGIPMVLDASSTPDERAAAFAVMDGLVLTGGPDLDPARYGRADEGSIGVEPSRDALEAEAWDVAVARVPIITRLVEGGIPRPVLVCEHRGMVCTLWFSDAWFRNLQVSDREFDVNGVVKARHCGARDFGGERGLVDRRASRA